MEQTFDPGMHQALFVDELFELASGFSGTLSFQTAEEGQGLAAITLCLNTNPVGEAIFATLPVVNPEERSESVTAQNRAGLAEGTLTVATSCTDPVVFADPNLEMTVRQAMGLGPMEPITCALAQGLRELTAREHGVFSPGCQPEDSRKKLHGCWHPKRHLASPAGSLPWVSK